MKRIIIIIIFSIILYNHQIIAQNPCGFNNIFPIEIGSSKFKSITTIALAKNIIENKEGNKFSSNFWDKPDYLNGDSVNKSSLFYNYALHPCLQGDNNSLILRFVDDRLYKIEITSYFSSTDFEKCITNYNILIKSFTDEFPYWTEFLAQNIETKEQTGEGFWFYKKPREDRDPVKIENISIGYRIEYKRFWNNFDFRWEETGNVENYIIEVQYINLNGTKLTNKGY